MVVEEVGFEFFWAELAQLYEHLNLINKMLLDLQEPVLLFIQIILEILEYAFI